MLERFTSGNTTTKAHQRNRLLWLTCVLNEVVLIEYEGKDITMVSPKTQCNNLTGKTVHAVGTFTVPEKSEMAWSDFEGVLRGAGQTPWRVLKELDVRCGTVSARHPRSQKRLPMFDLPGPAIPPFVFKRRAHIQKQKNHTAQSCRI